MTQELREQVDRDVRNGLYDASVARLKSYLSECPEDVDAKMRLGVCSQLSGDDGTCLRIYDEVQPQMELRETSGEQSEIVSFWLKYRKLVAALLMVGVIPFCPAAEDAVTNAVDGTNMTQRLCMTNSVSPRSVQSSAVDVNRLKNPPRGVQNIKYENGVISTLVVVGKAAVPNALRRKPRRASQYGGRKARTEAQFEFTRFLSTECKWGKTASGKVAVKEESASATDAQGVETSDESSSFSEIEMTEEQKEQSAQACVSGIQALWEGMNDSGEYVWVGAWNAKTMIKPEIKPKKRKKFTKYGAPSFEKPRPEPPAMYSKYGGRSF